MKRIKSNCQKCGRLVANKKLHKSRLNNLMLCSHCYLTENYNRNKAQNEPCFKIMNKSTEIIIKPVRCSQTRKFIPNLLIEEKELLKQKYSFDKFKSGSKKCKELDRLKRNLINSKIKLENNKNNKKLYDSKQNDEFLKGLLQK